MDQKNQAICGRSHNEIHYFNPILLSIGVFSSDRLYIQNGCTSSSMVRDNGKETHFDGLCFPYNHTQASHG